MQMAKLDKKYFTEKLLIDKHSLDVAISEQPALFHDISDKLTDALDIRDNCKKTMDEVWAQLDSKYRSGGSGKKITEKEISARITSNKLYKQAYQDFLDAKRETDRWANLKSAFEQRASMLKQMASLYCSNYYSTSSVTEDPKAKEVEYSAARKAMAATRKSLKRNKE